VTICWKAECQKIWPDPYFLGRGKALAGAGSADYHAPMAVSEKVRVLAESYEQLSGDERHEFLDLVAPIDHSEVSEEWREELRNRAEEIDSGRVQLVDGEDFLRRLDAI